MTLLDCLDLHGGRCDEVGFEDHDDVVRVRGPETIYRQVETSEGGNRHSIATVCKPETRDAPATSILGRLFSGKPLDAGTRFCLTLNETPQRDLLSFVSTRDAPEPTPEQRCKDEIETRLAGLPLSDGFSVRWCVDRFHVLLEPRTIEQVENAILVPWKRQ